MLFLILLSAVGTGAAANAQEALPQEASKAAAEAPAVRSPNPALQQFQNLVGTWQCRGKLLGWPFPTPRETVGEYRFDYELEGFWLNARFDERRSAGGPAPFSATGHWGWDPVRNRFVVGGVDSLGGFTHSWTVGWEGDTMTWTGGFYGYGPLMPLREVYTLKNGTLTHTFEVDRGGKGEWLKTNEEVCTRTGQAGRPASR